MLLETSTQTSPQAGTRAHEDLHATFLRDGVVHIPQALNAQWLAEAEAAYNWSLNRPSSTVADYAKSEATRFYVDTGNPESLPIYSDFLLRSPLGQLLARIWGSQHVWYAFEQIFYKEGGAVRSQRTGWHQDSSYLSIDGDQLAVMWITFEPLAKENALEFVRGSHRGPLYAQRGGNDTTGRPTVPNIEAARSDYDIVSWPITPGDVLIFHPAILHGGGGTEAGRKRRTLSLRFFGDDAVFRSRPSTHDTPPSFLKMNREASEGQPFRAPGFVKLV